MSPGPSPQPGIERPGELPPIVRTRVIALADEALVAMDEDDVPASLRAIRRFTPVKRARLGAPTIGAALESDPAFRAAVQARVRTGLPDLASAVEAGTEVPAVPAADFAAVAYVLDAPGWRAAGGGAPPRRARRASGERETAPAPPREAGGAPGRLPARNSARRRDEARRLRREVDEIRRGLGRAESAARRAAQSLEEAQARVAEVEAQRDATERELSAADTPAARAACVTRRPALPLPAGVRARIAMRRRRACSVLLDTVTAAAAGSAPRAGPARQRGAPGRSRGRG